MEPSLSELVETRKVMQAELEALTTKIRERATAQRDEIDAILVEAGTPRKAKRVNGNTGVKRSPETRAKMAAAQRARRNNRVADTAITAA